ncbi:MAG: DNA mismatch repair protein MutS [Deltaproteobacteria bacterium]|nr:DNA mismatch repair protein MutS [Deltaproteobacteria bacterium]
METLTPAMRQYGKIKEKNGDAVLFFRMGDFYEMFFEDANLASRLLGIALTSRDKGRNIPMCGVPYHSASGYIAKLIKEGHKVAICEQLTAPDESKGLVERGVTRIITPGVACEDELLEPNSNNFIAAAFADSSRSGMAYMDVSTGEFKLTEFRDISALHDEIRRIAPSELLVQETQLGSFIALQNAAKRITRRAGYDFNLDSAHSILEAIFKTASLDGFGCKELTIAVRAAGALLHYVKETRTSALNHIKRPAPYYTSEYLIMDSSTFRNLEILENIRTGCKDGTLLEVLDRTKTASGGRLLKDWLRYPLRDIGKIKRRQDAVAELLERRAERLMFAETLKEIYDLERLCARVSMKSASPRDIAFLRFTLEKIPCLKDRLAGFTSGLLKEIHSTIDGVEEAVVLIRDAIIDDPPASVKDGGVIRPGFNAELDELRNAASGGKDWLSRLESDERARTGINSLKVGYNKIFGYYIEITKANAKDVPCDYIRKQTLVNAERYVTPSMEEWEKKIVSAQGRAAALEARIFAALMETVARFTLRIQKTAVLISVVDALSSFACAAQEQNYARPDVNDGETIEIRVGRHPVVETAVHGSFVANDLMLDSKNNRIVILTGPNMAGKSTYLRQAALIAFMAQLGSFVPAEFAAIGVMDRIFCRVGASDDLSRGQSTFMVEMNETANIINNATDKSLIILDEIGRGTATFDGLSIAWAVVEYLHDTPGVRAKTIFATHYHELTELSLTKESVKNYNMAVRECDAPLGGNAPLDERIVFLRKVVPGGASRSYGIHVARLAGLPDALIKRANAILKNLESGELTETGVPRISVEGNYAPAGGNAPLDELRDALRMMDVERMTPMEAIVALNRLKEMLAGY